MGNRKGAHHHKATVGIVNALPEKRAYLKRSPGSASKKALGKHGVKVRATATPKVRRCPDCGAAIFRNVGYAREEYEFEGAKTLISLNVDECSSCEEHFPRDADTEEADFLKLKFRESVLTAKEAAAKRRR
jgi:hypothetical protein